MADKTLVEGARRLANASSQFIDYGGELARGIDASVQRTRVAKVERAKKVGELNNRIQEQYDKLDGNVNFEGLQGQQLVDTKDKLVEFKDEYHSAADIVAKIDNPRDPRSKAATDAMNNAQQKIVNMKKGIDAYADMMPGYSQAAVSYSKAPSNEALMQQGNYIFNVGGEQSKFQFDENGNLGFAGENGISNILNFNGPLTKALDQAKIIPNTLDSIIKAQAPLNEGARSAHQQNTKAMLTPKVMESFLAGDFNDDMLATLFDDIEYNPDDIDGTRAAMQSRIMSEYDRGATTGINNKKRNEAPKKKNDEGVNNPSYSAMKKLQEDYLATPRLNRAARYGKDDLVFTLGSKNTEAVFKKDGWYIQSKQPDGTVYFTKYRNVEDILERNSNLFN